MSSATPLVPVETDEQLERYLGYRNAVYPSMPTNVAETRSFDATAPERLLLRRFLVLHEGEEVGRALVAESADSSQRRFTVDASGQPSPAIPEALARMETLARQHGATCLANEVRSDQTAHLALFERSGFAVVQQNPITRRDLSTFEPPTAASDLDDVRICSLAELRGELGDDFIRRMWLLEEEILKDVPMPTPYWGTPLEEYARFYRDPFLDLTTRFVAIVGHELVGMSEIAIRPADPTLASTYLTGVRRLWRRRGIARRMKMAALGNAKARGVREVYADNEVNNPMLRLNLELGFVHVCDLLILKKEVAANS